MSKNTLKKQQKVISKKALSLILEKRTKMTAELKAISDTEKLLRESVWIVQKARSYLKLAKRNITTSSLEILAAYRKRQILLEILDVLKFFQELKSTNQKIGDLIQLGSYSEAVSILLQNKNQSEKYAKNYTCTESLKLKLQDQLDLTEVSLDNALNGRFFLVISMFYDFLNSCLLNLFYEFLRPDYIRYNIKVARQSTPKNLAIESKEAV